jgi:hypothetical protein
MRPTPSAIDAGHVREQVAVAGLALLTFVVHVLSPVTTSTDSAWTFHVAASLLREGDIDLDEYRRVIDLDLDYRLRIFGDHIYYYYPIATPLLVSPVVASVNLAMELANRGEFYDYLLTHGPDDRTAALEKLIAAALVSGSTLLMYFVMRRSLGHLSSLFGATIFAFGTSMWSTASRALWQHGPSAFLLLAALYLTISSRGKTGSMLATGIVLAFAYLVRPTNSLAFAFFGLYYLINYRGRARAYLAGGLAVLVPFGLHNWATYGNLFPPYSYQLFERLGTPSQVGEALIGTLLSPNRGLFVFTPVFLFSIWGAIQGSRRFEPMLSMLDPYLLGILVCHWITTSLFEDWGGAWSIGARYFVDVIPILMYFLIPILGSLATRGAALRSAFFLAAAIGVLIQGYCSISPYPFLWNGKPQALVEAPERKWDWGDLQFLRGLCANAPLEGRAPACWLSHG